MAHHEVIPADKPSSDQWYASTRVEDTKICSSELTEDDNDECCTSI